MDLYCKLFVDGPASEEVLKIELKAALMAGEDGLDLVARECLAYVSHNDERRRTDAAPDQYQLWPLLVDIDPAPGIGEEAYIAAVGRLLEYLWGCGHRVIAAAEFEEGLPRYGGRRADKLMEQ